VAKTSREEQLQIKRIYKAAAPGDGTRVLVDRLWPRGVSKVEAHVDLWLKDVAPSTELRKWFGHDPARWAEFRTRYRAELKANDAALAELTGLVAKGKVTLLYGAHDETRNQAVVLLDYLGGTQQDAHDKEA
jgi:uncharacterized protein YeaO (DUF488 family)